MPKQKPFQISGFSSQHSSAPTPPAQQQHDQLAPPLHAEFAQDAGELVLDCRLGAVEHGRDLFVRKPMAHVDRDQPLRRCEVQQQFIRMLREWMLRRNEITETRSNHGSIQFLQEATEGTEIFVRAHLRSLRCLL